MAYTSPDYWKWLQEQQKKQQQQKSQPPPTHMDIYGYASAMARQQQQQDVVVGGMKKWKPGPVPEQPQQEPLPTETPKIAPDTSAEKLSPEEKELYQQYQQSMAEASWDARLGRYETLRKWGIKPTEGTLYYVEIGGEWVGFGGKELTEWEKAQQDYFFGKVIPQRRTRQRYVEAWDEYWRKKALASEQAQATTAPEPLSPEAKVAIDMYRQFGVMSDFGRRVYGLVRPDIQQVRALESTPTPPSPSYWKTPTEFGGEAFEKLKAKPKLQLSYWETPTRLGEEEFEKLSAKTQVAKPKTERTIFHPMTGQPLPEEQKAQLLEVSEGIRAKNIEAYIKTRTPAGPLNIPLISPHLRGFADIVSGRKVGLEPVTGLTMPTFSDKGIGVTAAPQKALSLIDVPTGFVRGAESLVSPNVKSYVGAIFSEEERAEYLKDIRGREGEVFGEVLFDVLAAKGLGRVGAKVGLSATQLALAAGLNVGVSEGASLLLAGKHLPVSQLRPVAYQGVGLAIFGSGALVAVGKAGQTGAKIVQSGFGRAGINALVGGGTSYAVSGGDVEAGVKGAVFGAGFSLASDYLIRPLAGEIRSHLPQKLGGAERLTGGALTTGKAGEEVPTYVSEKGYEQLGGRRIRVVTDVTEKPVGMGDTTLDDLLEQYVGKKFPTGHATLKPEAFDLSKGGKTLLKGYPTESAGFRKAEQLYHFYSAPGSEEFVTVYGGYMGVGGGYSDDLARIVFGGKPTALVTTKTPISSEFLRRTGESIDDYLTRTSVLSGKTGIAQETLLGKSMERQFVTPASYERFGQQLPGSMFVSEGKVGTFQIKQEPSGLLGKIPVVRSILSRYTHLDVFKGTYAPASGVTSAAKALDVQSYGASYGKTLVLSAPKLVVAPQVSVPKAVVSKVSVPSPSKVSEPSSFLRQLSKISVPSAPSITSFPSYSTKISKVSKPSLPSFPSLTSKLSLPSKPSKPSMPSLPSIPSKVSRPSKPSKPSFPSLPSFPDYPDEPSIPSKPLSVPKIRIPPYSPPSRPEKTSVPKIRMPPPYSPPSKPERTSVPKIWMPPYSPPSKPEKIYHPSPPTSIFNRLTQMTKTRRGKPVGYRGGWFMRIHPIPLPRQVLQQFGGGKKLKNLSKELKLGRGKQSFGMKKLRIKKREIKIQGLSLKGLGRRRR